VTRVPIKFIGVGEKVDRLEEFRPEGMASRIIGQGDLMDLVSKVQRVHADMSAEELQRQQQKMEEGNFTLDDFRKQFEALKKMGSLKDMLASMPGGMADLIPEGEEPDKAFTRIQGMIDAMTKQERHNPDIIDLGRRRRIAAGSGTEPHEVKQLLGIFDQMRGVMQQMAKMSMWERIKMMTGLGQMGAFMPGSNVLKNVSKGDTGHRKSPKERAKERKNKRKKR
jgi:signal recognition particle subunit SRP54